MTLLPYENLTYKTHLSKEEIVRRIQQETEPKQMFRMRGFLASNKKYKAYEGEIQPNNFKINRIIGYRNSFLPQIKGEIEDQTEYTLIHIKMRLHTFVIVFLIIWLFFMTGVGSIVGLTLFQEPENQSFTSLIFFMPILMAILISVITCLAFHYEGNKSKEFFEKLFEAEKTEQKKE
ncbi:hypothetical protein [Bernardetia sp.]|uniref:hypothetical protein n=1 Tax=Bernardetia sp. TaxID=1937974 RepID=UPI0025C38ED8|nr:hypothetical protein [Bernardetia sp.]